MTPALILALGLLGQRPVDPDQFPLTLHRGMELDDQDREIRRQHDLVTARKGALADTARLAARGLVSRDDLRRAVTDVKFQEAREAELIAYRALKAYERDVLAGVVPHDEATSYRLLLDVLARQEAMGKVELEYRAFRLQQEQTLLEKQATSRLERDLALLDYEAARGNVAISVARQAQVAMELAARTGQRPYDAEEHLRRKADYIRARIRYSEIRVAGIRKRLDIARQGVQAGITQPSEAATLTRMLEDAEADLEADRRLIDDLKAPLPPRSTRFT